VVTAKGTNLSLFVSQPIFFPVPTIYLEGTTGTKIFLSYSRLYLFQQISKISPHPAKLPSNNLNTKIVA
jgi:hypothetical protein